MLKSWLTFRTKTARCRREIRTRETQARVGGVQRNTERLGDLRHRAIVELVQNEDSAALEPDLVEHLERERHRLPLHHVRQRIWPFVDVLGRVVGDLQPVAREIAIVRSEAKRETEQPGPKRSRGLVLIELA